MALNIAYKNRALMAVMPDDVAEIHEPVKQTKSMYTLAREARFKNAALKKFESKIIQIQKLIPGWEPF